MDYPNFIVSNQKEESISIEMVKGLPLTIIGFVLTICSSFFPGRKTISQMYSPMSFLSVTKIEYSFNLRPGSKVMKKFSCSTQLGHEILTTHKNYKLLQYQQILKVSQMLFCLFV